MPHIQQIQPKEERRQRLGKAKMEELIKPEPNPNYESNQKFIPNQKSDPNPNFVPNPNSA